MPGTSWTGRISSLPQRLAGILPEIPIASSRFLMSTRDALQWHTKGVPDVPSPTGCNPGVSQDCCSEVGSNPCSMSASACYPHSRVTSGWPVILPRLRETISADLLQHIGTALLLVKEPLNQLFQTRFALRQAPF